MATTTRSRLSLIVAALLLGASNALQSQPAPDGRLRVQLEVLFPTATEFSPKEPAPPHFKAYTTGASGARTLVGFAFWTTELEPLERGYDGPIKMLVGMDLQGVLTGVVVSEHREPYGYFSVDRKEFAAQFAGKNIRDAFKVGTDVDAVSRATITNTSAVRAIRNSARRVARQLITPPAVK
jgi:transcriptional regulator of nitric oxide reductase